MKIGFTATPPARPRAVIGQPFAKGEGVKLTADEQKAVAHARIDQQIRWNLDDCKPCMPGEAEPVSVPVPDDQVADRVVESITGEFSYGGNENLILGVRALGGLAQLRGVVIGRIPAVRARVAADKARRGEVAA